jgi:hypothetical protein
MTDQELEQFQKTAQELQAMTDNLVKEVDEMKRNLRGLEWSKWNRPTVDELIKHGYCWEPWYAWRPVKLHTGSWAWRKDIYRLKGNTYVDYDNWSWYYYGTVFDVLTAAQ